LRKSISDLKESMGNIIPKKGLADRIIGGVKKTSDSKKAVFDQQKTVFDKLKPQLSELIKKFEKGKKKTKI
jgi:hypothetical protein